MINICKECGEPFEASSARIKYCSKIHYRPCPICGAPVEAKYLSDPPRKCENCKGKKGSAPAMKPATSVKVAEKTEPVELKKVVEAQPTLKAVAPSDYADVREYIGPPVSVGFVPNHRYELEIDKKDGLYWITATKDLTENKVVDLVITYASQISIDLRFKKV